jgi:hypothetical protein
MYDVPDERPVGSSLDIDDEAAGEEVLAGVDVQERRTRSNEGAAAVTLGVHVGLLGVHDAGGFEALRFEPLDPSVDWVGGCATWAR